MVHENREVEVEVKMEVEIVYASRIPPRHMLTIGLEFVAKIASINQKNALNWKFGGPNVSQGAPKEVKSDQKEVTGR